MTTLGANSNNASLHAKSIITDTHTVLGSYDLSNLARAGNFEVVTVTPTQKESITDWMWGHDLVLANQVERIYDELFYTVPEGSKRKARYDAIDTEIATRTRAKSEAHDKAS
jgi:phosphatidylserine/phosphatidylglycerophosphate/cardiolipin synthase-like enzyme